jgi:hypothetical protein
MTVQDVLFPVFLQVLLTFVLLFWMGGVRLRALRRREVRVGDVALGQPAWPAPALQVGNAFRNQFELPLLFYVAVIVSLFTRKADTLFVVLEWLFVLARLAHAAIHTTGNDLRRRFLAFLAGALILVVMWLLLAARVLLAL